MGAVYRATRGTEGAMNPFFSPDGASVAFFASGGATEMLTDPNGSVHITLAQFLR
jgi:hypothetical protein